MTAKENLLRLSVTSMGLLDNEFAAEVDVEVVDDVDVVVTGVTDCGTRIVC